MLEPPLPLWEVWAVVEPSRVTQPIGTGISSPAPQRHQPRKTMQALAGVGRREFWFIISDGDVAITKRCKTKPQHFTSPSEFCSGIAQCSKS